MMNWLYYQYITCREKPPPPRTAPHREGIYQAVRQKRTM